MTDKKINSAYCIHAEVEAHLPANFKGYPESYWKRLSDRGEWAVPVKLFGQKSVSFYKRSQILSFFRLKFSEIAPSAVQSLIDAGFEPEPVPAPKLQNRKQRKARNA